MSSKAYYTEAEVRSCRPDNLLTCHEFSRVLLTRLRNQITAVTESWKAGDVSMVMGNPLGESCTSR